MADALRSSYAAPVFKRPRLDFCPDNDVSTSAFDSISCEEGFRSDPELRPSTTGVPLSADSVLDVNGGDSGFHDQSPIGGAGQSSASPGLVAKDPRSLAYENYTRNEPNQPYTSTAQQQVDGKQNQRFDKDSDDNDGEDVASTVSDLSALSDLSNLSGPEGKPNSGPVVWVQKQMESGINPRDLLTEILPKGTMIPPNLNQSLLWRIVLSVINEPPQRSKLTQYNTMNDVVTLFRNCRRIMVLTGAGVSVSCGIPDFRSRNGVYARLSKDYPDLPDPQAMFDINYFRKDPRPFFKFAKEIYPGLFQPSPSHHFIRLIERQGKLLRNYTQNIDVLERAAGIENAITCHGSFATASCTVCRYKVDASVIKDDIFSQRIPYCPICPADAEEQGIMKPDIVFFGEGLSDEFHNSLAMDKEECDLLVVMGSSLKVRPVALIPNSLPPHVPQILINREPLNHLNFDVELLGDCDIIIGELCKRLAKDWDIPNADGELFQELGSLPSPTHQFQPFTTSFSAPSTSAEGATAEIPKTEAISRPTNLKKTKVTSPPTEEESNSCDCRGMSAIKLDDSQDGSLGENPEANLTSSGQGCSQAFEDLDDSSDEWRPPLRESLSTRLPEKAYLFVAPSRYIFEGAEVYNDSHFEASSSAKNSAYDSDSPCLSSEDEADNDTSVRDKESLHSDNSETLPRTQVDNDSRCSTGSGGSREKPKRE